MLLLSYQLASRSCRRWSNSRWVLHATRNPNCQRAGQATRSCSLNSHVLEKRRPDRHRHPPIRLLKREESLYSPCQSAYFSYCSPGTPGGLFLRALEEDAEEQRERPKTGLTVATRVNAQPTHVVLRRTFSFPRPLTETAPQSFCGKYAQGRQGSRTQSLLDPFSIPCRPLLEC